MIIKTEVQEWQIKETARRLELIRNGRMRMYTLEELKENFKNIRIQHKTMKISFNQLKKFVSITQSSEEISGLLTAAA